MPKSLGSQTRTLGSSPVVTVPVGQTSFLERWGLSGEKRQLSGLSVSGVGVRKAGWRGTQREKFPPRSGLLLPKSPSPSPPAPPSVATTSLV